jgi:hypothetical protein
MIMLTLNLKKIVASAAAALTLSIVLSWTFVDATRVVRIHHDGNTGFLAAVSALVR